MRYRCAALNKSGGRCRADAVESNGWWRCERHTDWYDYATKEERERLAWMEIEEAIRDLDQQEVVDLETRREGLRHLWR